MEDLEAGDTYPPREDYAEYKEEALPENSDLAVLCERQKQQIEALELQLRAKDKELQSLNSVLQKYSSVLPELKKTPVKPAKPDPSSSFAPIPKARVSGSEFWDSHLENNEGNDYSFEDIAAKGLWILTSATERKKDAISTSPISRKPIETHRTILQTIAKQKKSSPPFKQNLGNETSPDKKTLRGKTNFPVIESSPERARPRLPPVERSPQKVVKYPSASPLKPRPLPKPSDSNRIQEPEYPPSQGYLRMSFKPDNVKGAAFQRGKVSPAKSGKDVTDQTGRLGKLGRNLVQPMKEGRRIDVPEGKHRKTNSVGLKGRK